ncbi:bifunctional 4-hydroxy-2-oxoglutarate aldolase/2-dehydro-3-deoxy-phosphogluconate aldolase [Streptomyces sp. NPDC005374]|uniref:bifunctional 4-hydroxy-2-oxoglutarate aldolase/2-dehydro-3-deoxy-phosphogluconate aldolase n=1 Tax=Streptomyces sp. NPDC005374 TaxID=3364713 RepID=UPI0036ADE7A9
MTADPASVLGGARLLLVPTVRCAEVMFRTPDAEQVVKTMAVHGGLAVGAGTVLTTEQAERAVATGARFVVSPGLDEEVIATCRNLGVPVVPGVATTGELMRALRAGLDRSRTPSPPSPRPARARDDPARGALGGRQRLVRGRLVGRDRLCHRTAHARPARPGPHRLR